MKYIKRYAFLLIAIIFVYLLINFQVISYTNDDKKDLELVETIEKLKQKVEHLQNIVNSKQNDINSLKEAFSANLRYYNTIIEQKKLSKLSNSSSVVSKNEGNNGSEYKLIDFDIELPHFVDFLPHLNGHSIYMQPKLKHSKNRFASIVIGIPTIKRAKTSYLLETLKSLFDSMNAEEKAETLVVVLIAEISDAQFIQKTISTISQAFKNELDSGLLDIIVPPLEYYPNLDIIANETIQTSVFEDSFDRVKWRTKQNYDFVYLMTYAMRRGAYYLQLEDDVVSKRSFITIIKEFINKQISDKWLILEFTQLGFIGKLIKTKDLPLFISFFLMFSNDKPVDWLSDSVFTVRACNPERGDPHCYRSKVDLKMRFKPSLFQHVGVESSLKGKTQKLKDKDFGKQVIIVKAHNNPPATITTSLKAYMKFSLESVYLGQNFFWAFAPVANDFVMFEFNSAIELKRFYIKSGNPEHPNDKLFNATVEIQPQTKLKTELSGYNKTKDAFYVVGKFSHDLGIASGEIDQQFGKIKRVRISIATASENWILISEIDFTDTAMIQTPKKSN